MKGKKLTHKERITKLEEDKSYRRAIFKELCDHVAKGFSLDCFAPLGDDSIKVYLKAYPEEFIQEELINALREGKESWEAIGRRQATGDCLGNSRSWWLNMAHRYKWSDRINVEAEHKGSIAVNIVDYATHKASKNTQQGT